MQLKKIYVVWDKEQECFVSFNSKGAWTKSGNAKNAVLLHAYSIYRGADRPKSFDDQSTYEVLAIDLHEALQR